MAPSIGPISYRKLAKLLRQHGFESVRQKGSHVFYRHLDGRSTIVPNHGGTDIPPGLVRKILADVELDPDLLR